MQKSYETRYPPSLSNALLADSYADFFTAKVEKIHNALVARKRDLALVDDNELPTNTAKLNNFHEVSQEDVKEFAYKPLSKSFVFILCQHQYLRIASLYSYLPLPGWLICH